MGLATLAGSALVLALGRTWRITYLGVREHDRRLAAGERCIFAFWHARMLPLVFTHRRRGIAVLVSRHRDGELIAGTIARLGYVTARGSSTRGGEEGLREMLALGARGRFLGISPDGPRGPAERVKPGLVYLASRTGFPVVPVAAAARSAWVFRSWDRFRVPRPFTRVVVAHGAPLAIPPALTESEAAAWRERVEAALGALLREVAAAAGETA